MHTNTTAILAQIADFDRRIEAAAMGADRFGHQPVIAAEYEQQVAALTALLRPIEARIALQELQFDAVEGMWGGLTAMLQDELWTFTHNDRGHTTRHQRPCLPAEKQRLNGLFSRGLAYYREHPRLGVPGETKVRIRLSLANGDSLSVEKWANDREQRFDRFVAAVQAMAALKLPQSGTNPALS